MARAIRIQGDAGLNSGQYLIDTNTRDIPILIDGTDHVFTFGFFRFGAPLDLSEVETIDFAIVRSQTDPTEVTSQEIDGDDIETDLITLSDWNDELDFNLEVTVDGDALDYNMLNERKITLWMVLTANYEDGSEQYLCAGPVSLVADASEIQGGSVPVDGEGDVVGPGSSTSNAFARFDGTTGKLLKNSPVLCSNTGDLTGVGLLNTHTIPGGTGTFALTSALHNAVTLAGSLDYLTLSGQEITRNAIDVTTDITGIVPPANLGTGSSITTKFLRGDGTWQTISGAGDVVGPASATDNAVVRFDSTTGKLIQNSAVTIADSTGNMAGVGTINTHTIPGGTGTFALTSDLHAAVTITGTPDYISLSGQQITISQVDVTTDITGIVPPANLGTGSSISTKFLRGDGTWQTVSGSGDVVGPSSATDNAVVRFDSTTGKLLQNSVVTIADSTGNMAGVGTINTHAVPSGSASFLVGALGSTDNRFARVDGTGGVTLQGSAATLDDSGNATFNGVTTSAASRIAVATLSTQTGDYTLVLTDAGCYVTVDDGSACSITVPANASVAFPVGTWLNVVQLGAGQLLLSIAGGVTLNCPAGKSLYLTEQHAMATLLKVGTNVWQVDGNLEAA